MTPSARLPVAGVTTPAPGAAYRRHIRNEERAPLSCGLWPLLDMIRFFADSFVAAFFGIELLQTSAMSVFGADGQVDAAKVISWREIARRALRTMADECRRTGLARLGERCDRLIRHLDSTPVESTLHLLRDLLDDIRGELANHLYFWVPGERQRWYADDDAALFGDSGPFPTLIRDAIPEAVADLAEASRCFALARWNACVFHLMRATELALQKWADDLGVVLKVPIAEASWEEILRKADDQIDVLQNQQRTAQRTVELTNLSEARSQFRNINQAWRRHVAHARESYDERQALAILNHVRAFMERLAA